MKDWIDGLNKKAALVLTLLTIVSTSIGISTYETFSKGELDKVSVLQLLKNHESFVKSNNSEGQLSLMHEDFLIDILHESGRKEVLNKDSYRKLLSDMSHMKLIPKMKLEGDSVQILRLSDIDMLVTMVLKKQVIWPKVAEPLLKSTSYQSIVVREVKNEPLIYRVSSVSISN